MVLSPQQLLARQVRNALAGRVASEAATEGLVAGRCRGRVLETALTLRLISLAGPPDDGAAGAGMRHFLSTAADLTPLERAVARLALHGTPSGNRYRASDLLHDFDHHTATAKKTLVDVVLRLLGADLPLPDALVDDPGPGLHTWKRVERLGQKVIACHARGCPDRVTRREVDTLVTVARAPGIWEGNVLTGLVVLFALHLHGPGHRELVSSGLRKVLATRREDGGVPFILDWSIGPSALAATGLAGRPGHDTVARRLAARLASLQRADGGWAYTPRATQTDTDDTAYCLQALRSVDPDRHRAALDRGLRYFLAIQNTDGGFPTYVRGTPSEVAMTAGAVACLAEAGETGDPIRRAVRYIVEHQHADGTFELSWSRSHGSTLFRAVRALRLARTPGSADLTSAAARAVDQAVDRAVGYVTDTQRADGGWGHTADSAGDEVSTAFSLAALATAGGVPPVVLARGLGFLADRQRPDGGFDCPSDEVAPRPIPYDVPDASAGFILTCLTAVAEQSAERNAERERPSPVTPGWTRPRSPDAETSSAASLA